MSKQVHTKEHRKLPVKFSVIPETTQSPFKELFPAYTEGLVQGEPGKFVYHPLYGANADKFYNFPIRKDDVWIRTFPRSGTTWTSELAWLIMNDCNFEEANTVPLTVRSPNIDTCYATNWEAKATAELKDALPTLDKMADLPSPRVLKSHLPAYLLPPDLLDTCKVIYVARNPKDAIVSFYYFHQMVKFFQFTGTLEEFAEYFMQNKLVWTPYFPIVLDAWSKKDHPNMLFLFYEDMKKDIRKEIKKIAAFLNKTLTPEQIEKLVDHVKVDNFSKNASVNMTMEIKSGFTNEGHSFVRKGKTGDWKNHFSPELNSRIDAWIEKNLAGSDLKFVTELENQD
ncbi:sulfotransferase 1C3-like [Daphnia carinata]|uniref:sulfotransferase 1C3-like n=1 Tax=Daphnia carinata TaxID=120202 RepID=UPI002579D1BA|nr:sulfotransferase 1C3-like [Daphnia carinata]